jgi:predicted kinase
MSAPKLFVLTGPMAVGKSSIAQALAKQLDPSVHLRGDLFRRMIVNGQAEMGPDLSPLARHQLRLRQDLAVMAATAYCEAGFSVVYQDILLGDDLRRVVQKLAPHGPRVVRLTADAATLRGRDAARAKTGYAPDFDPQILVDALETGTARIGLRLDTGVQAIESIVDTILCRAEPVMDA